MTGRLRVAHVVRDHGGLTEPFIHHRLLASAQLPAAELWTERTRGGSPLPVRSIAVPLLAPGSTGDHLFHRVPQVGPRLARAYAEAERAFAPDLIHAHYATTGFLVGSVTSTPLIVNAYGFDLTVLARRGLWRRAFRDLADRAAALVVEGPAMAATAEQLGFAAARLAVIPISAGLDSIMPRLDPPSGPVRVVACGRLVEKKGHDLAIRAFSRVAPDLGPGAQLAIIGDGPRRSDLERLAADLGDRDRITFLGSLPRERYLDELRRSHLFVAPSRTASNGDGEGGAPTTILDAQAVGVPVIGSTHADIPFLIEDGRTGFLAREGDASSLAATIMRAVGGRAEWPDLVRRARAAVLARNGDTVVGDQLLELYAKITNERRRPA